MNYHVSGLHLETNRPLLPLLPSQSEVPADVQVRLGETLPGFERLSATLELWYSSTQVDRQGCPILSIWKAPDDSYFRLAFLDGSEFLIDRKGTQIWGDWSRAVSLYDRTSFLLGVILSFVLNLRGVVCLHASGVSVGGQALAFAGPEEAGKSTIATAFAMRGFPVIADDLIALAVSDEAFLAQPAYPLLRLRSSAMEALSHTDTDLAALAPTADGRYLDLNLATAGYHFEQRSLPLAAIYVLAESFGDVRETLVESLSAASGLMSLVENSWGTRVLSPSMRADAFEKLSQLSSKVVFRRVRSGLVRPNPAELCEIILNDFQQLEKKTLPALSASGIVDESE